MTILLGFVQRFIQIIIQGPLFYPEEYINWKFFSIAELAQLMVWFYILNPLAIVGKLTKHYYQKTIETTKIEHEKLEAELKLLKSQIHPHFLFNTLNNLYSLALDKADSTAEGILKLSDLLNYMLYDCNEPFVPLDKEIKLINDYIELEKLRYGKRLDINIEISGNTHGKMIAPMLILPFVENSFKHGSSTKLNKTRIDLQLSIAINAIELIVENSCSENKVEDKLGYKKGIGLKNVKRRLELIYNKRYNLEIVEDKNFFKVYLHLEI